MCASLSTFLHLSLLCFAERRQMADWKNSVLNRKKIFGWLASMGKSTYICPLIGY